MDNRIQEEQNEMIKIAPNDIMDLADSFDRIENKLKEATELLNSNNEVTTPSMIKKEEEEIEILEI